MLAENIDGTTDIQKSRNKLSQSYNKLLSTVNDIENNINTPKKIEARQNVIKNYIDTYFTWKKRVDEFNDLVTKYKNDAEEEQNKNFLLHKITMPLKSQILKLPNYLQSQIVQHKRRMAQYINTLQRRYNQIRR